MIVKFLSSVLGVWAGLAIAAPAAAHSLPSAEAIAQEARDAMARTRARGLAIAVIDNGRVREVQTFGDRNAAGDPLTPETIMYAASLTKAVFGYMVAGLAGRGVLDLDRPIAALLPQPLPSYGNLDAYGAWGDLASDDRWRLITPRMVLTHSTGFANFHFLEPDRRLRIHFAPGSRYAYSGEGIMLLQFGIEQGLGLSVASLFDEMFVRPLQLSRAGLSWRSDFAGNLADGWTADGSIEPHDERSRVRAAGSLDASPADMAAMAALMVRGQGVSRQARRNFTRGTLPITSRQQFPTLLPEAPVADRPQASAALGVIAFSGLQGAGWYKGGHNDSTGNTLVCLEQHRRCVLIMANDVRAEAAFPALVRFILGETGVPYRWEYPDIGA
jgi:CubicO group peptidase (beta-lactamase class C family)